MKLCTSGFPDIGVEHRALSETSLMRFHFSHLAEKSKFSNDGVADLRPCHMYIGKSERAPPVFGALRVLRRKVVRC